MNIAGNTDNDSNAQRFSAGASQRLRWWFLTAAVAAEASLVLWQHWLMAAGFALGAAMAFAGMLQLEGAVAAFAALAGGQRSQASGPRLVMGLVLRYAVAAAIAYAIF